MKIEVEDSAETCNHKNFSYLALMYGRRNPFTYCILLICSLIEIVNHPKVQIYWDQNPV